MCIYNTSISNQLLNTHTIGEVRVDMPRIVKISSSAAGGQPYTMFDVTKLPRS